MTALDIQSHLRRLHAERALAALEGRDPSTAYAADLDEELAAAREPHGHGDRDPMINGDVQVNGAPDAFVDEALLDGDGVRRRLVLASLWLKRAAELTRGTSAEAPVTEAHCRLTAVVAELGR
jgi:hypothetical protein